MNQSDKNKLLALLPDVCAFYRQDFSKFLGNVWVAAMEAYTFDEVKRAIERHTMNPDTGQFMPKPADVVKMLGGSSIDMAMAAWSRVERHIRTVGQYQSVVFDDSLLHRVVYDMGGWVQICTSAQTEKDFEFVGREFQIRYRGFAMRGEHPEFPGWLVGHVEAQNAQEGIRRPIELRAIGDPRKCAAVLKAGTIGQPENPPVFRLMAMKTDIQRLAAPAKRPRQLGNNPEGE